MFLLRWSLVGFACCAGLLVAASSSVSASDTGDPRLRAYLKTQLEMSESEWKDIQQGRAVVKSMTSSVKREMTTGGAVRIRKASLERFVQRFKTLEGFKTSQFVLQLGKFAVEPQLRDLDALTLDKEDLDGLRTCRVGACEVRLSEPDILRFKGQIDWRRPDAGARATTLYKSMLFAQVSAFRATGLGTLVTYRDQDEPMSLAVETRALLEARPSLLDGAPALRAHLETYPAGQPANTEELFYWAKEAFGFKPVVGVNHVSFHTSDAGEVRIVTTQLYASHYMDGLVSVSSLIPDPGGDGFYWVFVNRSRVGRLGGLLGTLSRPIVQRKARAGLAKSLTQTKQRMEAGG